MSSELERLSKVGGVGGVASGLLFLTIGVLELAMGSPPPGGVALLEWVSSNEPLFGGVVEIMFFAVVSLIPAVAALHRKLTPSHPTISIVACGTIAMTIPVLAVLVIILGRVVFPVFHLRADTTTSVDLVLAFYFGGMHAVVLLFAGATLVISLALRRSNPGLARLGYAAGIADVIAGYPEAVGPMITFGCRSLFAAWLVAMGAWVWKRDPNQERREAAFARRS